MDKVTSRKWKAHNTVPWVESGVITELTPGGRYILVVRTSGSSIPRLTTVETLRQAKMVYSEEYGALSKTVTWKVVKGEKNTGSKEAQKAA